MLVLHDVNNVLITSCPHIADMMFCLQGTGGFIGWSCFSVVGPCPVMPLRFSLYPSCCPLHKRTLTCPRWTRAGLMPLFSLVSTLGCESFPNFIWMGWTAPLFYFYSSFFFFFIYRNDDWGLLLGLAGGSSRPTHCFTGLSDSEWTGRPSLQYITSVLAVPVGQVY